MKCFNFDTLAAYFDGILEEAESKNVEKHLEFCPMCREVMEALKKEEAFLEEAIQAPKLPHDFDQHVLKDLTPYENKKKKQSWKYQFLTACSIVLAFGLGASMYPQLNTLFGEDTTVSISGQQNEEKALYSVEDNGVKVNITEVSSSPVKIEVFYEIEPTEEMEEKFRDNLLDYDLNDIILSNDSVLPSVLLKNNDGIEVPFENLEFSNPHEWKGSIILYPQDRNNIPNRLTLDVEITEILDEKGIWSFSIPIDITDSKRDTMTVQLDDVMGMEGFYQLELLEWIDAPNAKILTFESTFSNEEMARIQKSVEGREDLLTSSSMNVWLEPIFAVYTESGEELRNKGASVSSTNGNHFLMEQEFSLKARRELGKHTFELKGFSIQEPIDAQFSLNIASGEQVLVNQDSGEWILTGYTAKMVDGKLKVKVTGKSGNEHATNLNWELLDSDVDSNYTPIDENGRFELEFELTGTEDEVKTVNIDFLSIDKTVMLPKPITVPLN
ncbi:hypothetical protein LC085_04680 [Bacillus tianshenii]|uniref:hypothetical protein n=1 Tax=Sutcliffiella tianshenii TaxID=1463404 RepID=UPI001CD2206C|nr:hypothetical protein [Bacillus tianshenii]MCA1319201.1 hypothetical protein [Bacillus tianshenii]